MLTSDEKDAFQQSGFLKFEKLIPAEFVDECCQAAAFLERLALELPERLRFVQFLPTNRADDTKALRKISQAIHEHESLRRLAESRIILDRVQDLIGPNIGVNNTKLMVKCPFIGTEVCWHQDSYRFRNSWTVVTCLVYLDDTSIASGAIRLFPSSHKDGAVAHDDGCVVAEVVQNQKTSPLYIPGDAGTVILMNADVIHGSGPNTTEQYRRVIVLHYYDPNYVLATEGNEHNEFFVVVRYSPAGAMNT